MPFDFKTETIHDLLQSHWLYLKGFFNQSSVKQVPLSSKKWGKSLSRTVRYWPTHVLNHHPFNFSPVGSPLCPYGFSGVFYILHSHFRWGPAVRQSSPHRPQGLLDLKGSGKSWWLCWSFTCLLNLWRRVCSSGLTPALLYAVAVMDLQPHAKFSS